MLKKLIIMKQKNYLITEIKKIIKSELKIKVDEKSKFMTILNGTAWKF